MRGPACVGQVAAMKVTGERGAARHALLALPVSLPAALGPRSLKELPLLLLRSLPRLAEEDTACRRRGSRANTGPAGARKCRAEEGGEGAAAARASRSSRSFSPLAAACASFDAACSACGSRDPPPRRHKLSRAAPRLRGETIPAFHLRRSAGEPRVPGPRLRAPPHLRPPPRGVRADLLDVRRGLLVDGLLRVQGAGGLVAVNRRGSVGASQSVTLEAEQCLCHRSQRGEQERPSAQRTTSSCAFCRAAFTFSSPSRCAALSARARSSSTALRARASSSRSFFSCEQAPREPGR